MRALCVGLAAWLASSAFAADPAPDRVRDRFQSESTCVTWGDVPTFDATAELEIGDGGGHGGSLGWLRFRPAKGGVEVLSIQYRSRIIGRGELPADPVPVAVKIARLPNEAYAGLLKDLAVVSSAKLERIRRNSALMTTGDFWSQVRLTAGKETPIDLDWAGYQGSRGEPDYLKPKTAVGLAGEAVAKSEFKEYTLTAADRAWASEKFTRDGEKHTISAAQPTAFYWWVNERSIATVGFVGDAAALPTLREIAKGDPKNRCVPAAAEAIARLTK